MAVLDHTISVVSAEKSKWIEHSSEANIYLYFIIPFPSLPPCSIVMAGPRANGVSKKRKARAEEEEEIQQSESVFSNNVGLEMESEDEGEPVERTYTRNV